MYHLTNDNLECSSCGSTHVRRVTATSYNGRIVTATCRRCGHQAVIERVTYTSTVPAYKHSSDRRRF